MSVVVLMSQLFKYMRESTLAFKMKDPHSIDTDVFLRHLHSHKAK